MIETNTESFQKLGILSLNYIKNKQLDETLFKTVLRKMDFEREQFDKKIEEYSDGQKKKVLLAYNTFFKNSPV